jgi:sigma-E factor negative regulatory protein RseA
MTQDISSLMDGELEPHEAGRAVQACCASEEQKQTWYIYHVIGDSMRGQAPRGLEIPRKVYSALRGQPTVLAPRRLADRPATRIALAAAASVATIGVVGWLGMQGGQAPNAPAVVASDARAPVVASATPVAQPVLNVQDYLVAHRQIPSPELYRQVSTEAPSPAR